MYNGTIEKNGHTIHEYEYVRVELSNGYDVPRHPDRLDGEGSQIDIGVEIKAAFPGVKFCCHGHDTVFKVWFPEGQLTAEEESTLDQIVANHKANL